MQHPENQNAEADTLQLENFKEKEKVEEYLPIPVFF